MRNRFLLLCIPMLLACFVLAQDSTPPTSTSNTDSSAAGGTVQGCLSGSDGNYMLTQDGTGAMFKLMGGSDMLKKHVGHEVAISGQMTGAGSAAAEAGQGQTSAPTADSDASSRGGSTIQVSDVKMISKHCNSGAGSSH